MSDSHKSSSFDSVLFILLVTASIAFCLQSGNTIYGYAIPLAVFETGFIFAYAVSHKKKIPLDFLFSDPLPCLFFVLWIAGTTARLWLLSYHHGFELSEALIFFFMTLHGVFFLYAYDIYRRAGPTGENAMQWISWLHERRIPILFTALCMITFSVALLGGPNHWFNADTVASLELLFVALAIFIGASNRTLSDQIRQHPLICIVIILWFAVVTYSFLNSPYELRGTADGVARYHQTIIHVAFFSFVCSSAFPSQLEQRASLLLLMIPLSTVVLVIALVAQWSQINDFSQVDWFDNPPLNSHIRVIGHIATAATCIAAVYYLRLNGDPRLRRTGAMILTLICSTLLFWTGGRGAMVSAIGTIIALAAYQAAFPVNTGKHLLLKLAATLVLATFLSEHFSVFDWNGVIQLVARTVEVENLAQASTGRIGLYDSINESLQGHWIFGLGPQGFWYMPNRTWGIQPHNFILQFIVEWGVLGAALFLLLLLGAAVHVLKNLFKPDQAPSLPLLGGAAVILSLSIHGLVSGTFYYAQPSYYLALAMAICLRPSDSEHSMNNIIVTVRNQIKHSPP